MKLLDTDILIDLFHSNPLARAFIDRQDQAHFLRTYRDGHRIHLSDAVIAATAFLRGADIVTRNTRHYPMPEVLVIEPYQRGAGD